MEKRYHETYSEFTDTLPSGRQATVTVHHDFKWGDQWTVEVNWSAMGSVPVEDAVAYAKLIAAAAEYAADKQG